jgi:endonuclease YncB( thermonuclease family)
VDINLGLPDSGVGDRELRNGVTVWVGHVVDGDTAVVWVGEFAPVRYTIRLVGLAAPECFKDNRSTPDGTGQSCVRDDEIHGLAAFEALKNLVEDKRVKITCEAAPDALCPKDPFGRSLGYMEIDGKDAAIEMAYGGHALSYVTFYSSKRADICAGVYDARRRKVGMWALGTETYVISRMSSETRSWYTALHDKRCDEAMGR